MGKHRVAVKVDGGIGDNALEIRCGRSYSKKEMQKLLEDLMRKAGDSEFGGIVEGDYEVELVDVGMTMSNSVVPMKGRGKRGRISRLRKEVADRQSEFGFVDMSEQRGFFCDTEPYVRGGMDMDIPTYMRLGVKIVL